MDKPAYIGGEIDAQVAAHVESAVSSGELGSSDELVTRLVTEWSVLRGGTPEFTARARAAIAESRMDPRSGASAEVVFDRLIAKYAAMIDQGPD